MSLRTVFQNYVGRIGNHYKTLNEVFTLHEHVYGTQPTLMWEKIRTLVDVEPMLDRIEQGINKNAAAFDDEDPYEWYEKPVADLFIQANNIFVARHRKKLESLRTRLLNRSLSVV